MLDERDHGHGPEQPGLADPVLRGERPQTIFRGPAQPQ